MNRKQIICMWLGIAAFVLVGLYAVMSGDKYLWNGDYLELPNFIILWICVIVVTTGLIYTFRDKKNK